MRNLKKFIGLAAVSAVLFAFSAQAQSNNTDNEKNQLKSHGKGIDNLTKEQKAQMKANRKEAKRAQQAFRRTLSDEQKAIFDNKDLNPEERRNSLGKSLSDEQKQTMKNNAKARKEKVEKFNKTLTDEQNAQMKQKDKKGKQKQGGRLKGKE
jgi:Spy/CpxP family protein refolding chaperone